MENTNNPTQLERKDMDENNRGDYPNYIQTQLTVKEQLVIGNDMGVNEHERL